MRSTGRSERAAQPVAPGNSLRLRLFYRLLPAVSTHFRRRRMAKFVRTLDIRPGLRVLDLGGTPSIWQHVAVPLDITLLNLPGTVVHGMFVAMLQNPHSRQHTIRVVEGDACDAQFEDRSFDIVFSNSLIEHIALARQAAFALEVVRLGHSWWVQTPSPWFPVEAHTGLPYYWFYPQWLRASVMRCWRKKLPDWWADYIGNTRALSRQTMRELFPTGRVMTERFLGFPRSYVAYYCPRLDGGAK